MKKLLLVGINARYTHSNLALRYLRNSVTDLNFQVEIIEFSINQSLLEIIEQIVIEEPEILAISVYIWNTEIVKELLLEINKILPKIPIILGGPEVSYNPEKWLDKYSSIYFIITGSGEAGFRYLLEEDLKVEQKIITKRNPHFSQIAFPYLSSDFPEIRNKYIYYESSRGCSFKCSYCLSSRADQNLEFRDIETVKKELKFLIDQDPRIIKFVDRTFNAKKEHSRAIWQFLIETNPTTKFHFEVHPELLTDEDLEILQKSPKDLFQFEIGIQSTHPATLAAIHRRSDWQNTSLMIKKLIALNNIHIHVDLIAGLPFESLSEFRNSFNEVYQLHADRFQLGFLKVLPGTKMADKIQEYELAHTSKIPYIILKNKWLSFSELNLLHNIEKLLNVFYNSGKFQMVLKHIINEFDDPFEFYSEFLKFLQTRNFDLQTIKWQKNAYELLLFVKDLFSYQTDFFFDCLRWDWCLQARSHYYPEFLRSDADAKAKRDGYKYLNSKKVKDIIKLGDHDISVSALKKAIYFIPRSDKFKQEFLIVVFINSEPFDIYPKKYLVGSIKFFATQSIFIHTKL